MNVDVLNLKYVMVYPVEIPRRHLKGGAETQQRDLACSYECVEGTWSPGSEGDHQGKVRREECPDKRT